MKVFWPGWSSWLSTGLHAVAAAATQAIWTSVDASVVAAAYSRTGAAVDPELAGACGAGAVAALQTFAEYAPIAPVVDSRLTSVIQVQDFDEDARELVADTPCLMTAVEEKGIRCG